MRILYSVNEVLNGFVQHREHDRLLRGSQVAKIRIEIIIGSFIFFVKLT